MAETETNIRKMDGWKINLIFGMAYFQELF